MVSEAQARAARKWDARHREIIRKAVAKSTAKRFILKLADEADLREVKQWLAKRKQEEKKMTKFEQIENFMNGLLAKLPEDEQSMVDHQIYYDTNKNSIEYMLSVNGTSPHFWMYYDPAKGAKAEWGAVECWIKKDGTMEGAIFHDTDIEPTQEFNNAAKFDGDLAEFVRTDLIDAGRFTKLREGVNIEA